VIFFSTLDDAAVDSKTHVVVSIFFVCMDWRTVFLHTNMDFVQ
jgi:hypothetical protein